MKMFCYCNRCGKPIDAEQEDSLDICSSCASELYQKIFEKGNNTMENEIWKPVASYEEYYEVSSLGRVRRIKGGSGTQVGRILKQWLNDSNGYSMVTLTVNNKMKDFLVHRLVCSAFNENTENKPCVNHIDGNKLNNSVDNLEWCNQSENIQHAFRTGLVDRKKMSESRRGHEVSQETRKKLSEARKGKKRPDLMGHEVSQETRKKMSEAKKGTVYVNNGIKTHMVKPEELQEYLNNGYVLGKSKR